MQNLTSYFCSAIPVSYNGDEILRLSRLVLRPDVGQSVRRDDRKIRLLYVQCVSLITQLEKQKYSVCQTKLDII